MVRADSAQDEPGWQVASCCWCRQSQPIGGDPCLAFKRDTHWNEGEGDVRRIKQIRELDVAGEVVQVVSLTTRVAVHMVVRDQEAWNPTM